MTVPEKYKEYYEQLDKPETGGTIPSSAEIIYPAFKEIIDIAFPTSILEIGFNIGGSALMFLLIDETLRYDSIDLNEKEKSADFLSSKFARWRFFKMNSNDAVPGKAGLRYYYYMVFIDGDHSREGVIKDIETALSFNPEYVLFDDVRHPSHKYIEDIIKEQYSKKLEIVKIYEFNEIWEGYSMALCKVK